MPLETLLRNRSRDGSRDVGKFDLRKQNKNQSIETEWDMKQIKRQRHTTAVINTLHVFKKWRKARGWWGAKWKTLKKFQIKLLGMKNSVWNQKYTDTIKRKLDIAEKRALDSEKNSKMKNRRNRMNKTERTEHQWTAGQ